MHTSDSLIAGNVIQGSFPHPEGAARLPGYGYEMGFCLSFFKRSWTAFVTGFALTKSQLVLCRGVICRVKD